MSKKTLDVVRGIAQAAANAYDGALDEKGEPIEIGLKREVGHMVKDSRTMDGFKVRLDGNHLVVSYQAEIKLKDVYATKFEDEIEQTMADIASFLKKEYKKITGNALSLTPVGDADSLVQSTSRVRVFVTSQKLYKVGNLEDTVDKLGGSDEKFDVDVADKRFKAFEKFLDTGGWKKAKPKGQPVYQGDGKVKARKDIHSPYKAE